MIIERVKNKEWIFPLSIIHVFETISKADPKSRKGLVDVMIELSNGYSIKSFLEVQKDELKNVFLILCNSKKLIPIQAVLKNPLVIIGAEKASIDFKIDIPSDIKREIISVVDNHMKNNLVIRNVILNRYDKKFVDGLNSDDAITTKNMERDRISLLELHPKDRYTHLNLKSSQ